MSEGKMNGTRRAFFLRGSAVLGAGAITTTAATALLPRSSCAAADQVQGLQRDLRCHQDREAIRRLHLAFTAAVENQDYDTAVELFESHAAVALSGSNAIGKPAIRLLFATQYRQQLAPIIHSAYRRSPLQQQDLIEIAADGAQAAATFHCDVELSSPLPSDSTLAQMARLQGQVAERHWKAGRFEARYVKIAGCWQIAALRFT
ncbi:MAG TPA: nuclear transport factor 2 family protein [Steroidobacteraceae bacterium]